MRLKTIVLICLMQPVSLFAQRVTDAYGLSSRIVDHEVNEVRLVSYVQVVFDFDTTIWAVYLANGVHPDPVQVVANGNMLKMQSGAGLFPLSNEWNYVNRKHINKYLR